MPDFKKCTTRLEEFEQQISTMDSEDIAKDYRFSRERNLARGRLLMRRGFTIQPQDAAAWGESAFEGGKGVAIFKNVERSI